MINLAIIQARMSSKRLPGKVLKKINGIPILEIVYYRLKKVKKIDKICIATSRRNSDKKIVDFCKKNKIEFFAGNLNNVLSRFKFLVNKYLPRYIIRITADNPFFDKDVLSKQINLIKKYDLDYFELKKKTPLENLEDCELLRFLELGLEVKMIKMSDKSISVDTKQSLKEVVNIIKYGKR